MDINQLLKGLSCSCGREHRCEIQAVYIEPNAAARLTTLCKGVHHVLLVADENTYAAAGRQTEEALTEQRIERVIFSGKELLVPNEEAIQAVVDRLDGIEWIIGIGSGVIQDLCKYVSHSHHRPYLVVATAPSMDGYASDGAAMITGGMKVTYPAGLPKAILADTQVLANAPMRMIQAGYGDIIGKYSALNDWKLSHCVNGEYFCPTICRLTEEQIERTLALADGIVKREEESIRTLMEALVVIGILMSFAGSSRPASGSEHHLSHFFEITGILTDTDYLPHGIDVAYSTVITAALREKILAAPFAKTTFRPTPEQRRQALQPIYREITESCMALQDKAGYYATDRAEVYLHNEAEIRSILSEMPSADEIQTMLSRVGLDFAELEACYGAERIENAVRYAKELKDRYTVLWVNHDYYGGEWNV